MEVSVKGQNLSKWVRVEYNDEGYRYILEPTLLIKNLNRSKLMSSFTNYHDNHNISDMLWKVKSVPKPEVLQQQCLHRRLCF